ncbi:glycoside hydrolase family 43 protein [Mangrovibacterium diazotrophicum]|uniref:Beta-xylosidase n=1 Tax=Mangrovibacterium diazotrophicum TaxID=1261403 RepID=A0A419W4E5_9BACT|nr:glycoside hydrolase 43 family protein [Mangrovibacterium diazotrophicum]RKD90312.1 beta-xylosidase [Mangrovibacterium diazotrophicum]
MNDLKLILICLSFVLMGNFAVSAQVLSWGDQGNGTYINPVLNADYSDPDVVRVGADFYMVCSEFHFMGMPVLHSTDLVNWTIIGRVYDRFEFDPAYDTNNRYAGGSWAPAIRYHNGKFWVYFCTPKEGLFMSSADRPEGPWEPLTQVVAIAGWEDPCPFWDEDGQAYLGHSKVGAGPILIHKMSADGKSLLDDGLTVYTGPVAEGTKIMKKDGYYYLSIPEGGVEKGWQTVLRSKDIYGPYEKKVVLETGSTTINGPHQGALVDTPNGEWWFLHFQSVPAVGRVVHLQPAYWSDGWPVVGVDLDRNGIGEPVYVWKKPLMNGTSEIMKPQSSDNFDSAELGLQWSWNHNPVDSAWSLTRQAGKLALDALYAPGFLQAKNTLTQKVIGSSGQAQVELDGSQLQDGQLAGLCLMAKEFALVGIEKKKGDLYIFTVVNGMKQEKKIKETTVWLKLLISAIPKQNQFYFSTDQVNFKTMGANFHVLSGNWKGPKIGLFSFNQDQTGGTAVFDNFQYTFN